MSFSSSITSYPRQNLTYKNVESGKLLIFLFPFLGLYEASQIGQAVSEVLSYRQIGILLLLFKVHQCAQSADSDQNSITKIILSD